MHYRIGMVNVYPFSVPINVTHCSWTTTNTSLVLSKLPEESRNCSGMRGNYSNCDFSTTNNATQIIEANQQQQLVCTTSVEWRGVRPRLIALMSTYMPKNFTYSFHMPSDNEYGSRNATTGKWNGVFGMLTDGSVDIGGSTFTVNDEREQEFDFIRAYAIRPMYYYNQEQAKALMRDSRATTTTAIAFDTSGFLHLLSAFEPNLWLLIFAVLCATSCLAASFELISDYNINNNGTSTSRRRHSSSICRKFVKKMFAIWPDVFANFTTQNAELEYFSRASRALVLAWAVTCVVMSGIYSAQVTLNAQVVEVEPAPFVDFSSMRTGGYMLASSLFSTFRQDVLAQTADELENLGKTLADRADGENLGIMLREQSKLKPYLSPDCKNKYDCLFKAVKTGQFPVFINNGNDKNNLPTVRNLDYHKFVGLAQSPQIIAAQTTECTLRSLELPHGLPEVEMQSFAVPRLGSPDDTPAWQRKRSALYQQLSGAIDRIQWYGLMQHMGSVGFNAEIRALACDGGSCVNSDIKPFTTQTKCSNGARRSPFDFPSEMFYGNAILQQLKKKPCKRRLGYTEAAVTATPLREFLPILELMVVGFALSMLALVAELLSIRTN